MAFYEKGHVRIHYEEAGSGFPLFVIPGGGQNSTIGFMSDRAPFNATEEFKDEYRCITADLRNAPSGQSSGPLETTHLILVQHTPRSIRFRFDEKRFDVDGAYDIRYEIVKKGIDKAVVEGTSDRVTQPGKIAIIYSQSPEGREYRGYIEYLQSRGYLTSEVEELDLGELQGVQGLRALRVAVALENPAILQRVGLDPDER